MNLRRWLAGGLAVGVMAGAVWAKTGVVKTRDGQTYTGDVTDDPDSGEIVVTIHGIPMRLDRRNIATLDYVDDDAQAFQKKLAALEPNDVSGKLDMARQAFNAKHYDWAQQAADAAQKADPNNRDVADFIVTLRRQQAMEHGAKATSNPPPRPAGSDDILIPDNPAGTTPSTVAPPAKVLAPEDINTIKQMEIGAADSDFRVSITNDTKRKYLEKQGGTAADFAQLAPQDQARAIWQNQPSLRDGVKVTSDPASLAAFKKTVMPTILAGCATAGCHGGPNAGNFVLITPADNEAKIYTDFYILAQYAKTINKISDPMFDRTNPARSLLLQFGLPTEAADTPHPQVPNFRPAYRAGVGDPKYRAVHDWLSQTLQPVTPDYGIKFQPPVGTSPTTAPSK